MMDKELYSPSAKEPTIIEVPAMQFLMIDGQGDPNSSESYQSALESLYSLSYTIKFMHKKGYEVPGFYEYKVFPLEGLWWSENMKDFVANNKSDWLWTMMIRQPDFVTKEIFNQALELTKKKKSLSSIDQVRLEEYKEGTSVQLMHIGPYKDEHPNIMRMHEFALSQGYKLTGKHHEIYLGDPRKTAPEKLKTVLRQPISK